MPPSYDEIAPSPRGEWYEDPRGRGQQFRATRWLKCRWVDRKELISWFYSASGCAYPHEDGTNLAIVRRAKPVGRGKTGGTTTLISHDECILEVYYDSNGPRWVSGLYLEEEMAPRRMRIIPPTGQFYWKVGSNYIKITDNPGKVIDAWAWIMRVGRASSPPSDPQARVGCVNADPMNTYTLGYSFAAQVVLFGPPTVFGHTDYTAGTKYVYRYAHTINPFGWNKFWHGDATTPAWEYLYLSDESQYVQYPATW
jgi:hypothetical protein